MLKFPEDLPHKYHMSIRFKKYTRPDPFTGQINLSNPSAFGSDVAGDGTIILPIPSNLVNSQDLEWQSESASLTGSAFSNLVKTATGGGQSWNDVMTQIGGAAAALTVQSLGAVLQNDGGIANVLGQAAGGVVQTALQEAGVAMNPVLTQFFKSPKFKAYEFAWKLAANRPEESQTISDIIDVVTVNSLPDITAGGLLFRYPSIAMVEIHTGDKKPFFIQPCVINNVTVNYTPNQSGIPSWFARTSQPTSVILKISLIEIIINNRQNYKGQLVSGDSSSADYTGWLDPINLGLNPNSSQFNIGKAKQKLGL